jgi:hypothetical protein
LMSSVADIVVFCFGICNLHLDFLEARIDAAPYLSGRGAWGEPEMYLVAPLFFTGRRAPRIGSPPKRFFPTFSNSHHLHTHHAEHITLLIILSSSSPHTTILW